MHYVCIDESDKGKFSLNQEWFSSLKEARLLIEKWCLDYNTISLIVIHDSCDPTYLSVFQPHLNTTGVK